MSVRLQLALLLGLVIQAVLFGAGTILILSVPALADHAWLLFPWVTGIALMISPPCAWHLAPLLRSPSWRDRVAFADR